MSGLRIASLSASSWLRAKAGSVGEYVRASYNMYIHPQKQKLSHFRTSVIGPQSRYGEENVGRYNLAQELDAGRNYYCQNVVRLNTSADLSLVKTPNVATPAIQSGRTDTIDSNLEIGVNSRKLLDNPARQFLFYPVSPWRFWASSVIKSVFGFVNYIVAHVRAYLTK
jgi:hypothetical protein